MAYTIIRSDGTTLTTIQDGTVNTTSTSLGLPGRNYAGYGQTLDTNFVRQLENYANTAPPPNPLRGQLWFNTNDNTLRLCPADGTTTASNWLVLSTASTGGTTTFANVTVTGNIVANNAAIANVITADSITVSNATVTTQATITTANLTTANIGTTRTAVITTGAVANAGTLTGVWTVNNTIQIYTASGNAPAKLNANGVYAANYYYSNGAAFTGTSSYTNTNVFDYLTGSNAVSQFTGNIAPTKITTTSIAGGGNISGIWTLATGARINATYADLAERFEADEAYDAGTVVELGGEKEITAVVDELSEEVFGVVSNTAAMLMNGAAGTDETHPPVAVSGRVLVKVIGKVRKGQRLVSAGRGYARAAKAGEATAFNVVGRALAHKTDDTVGTVLAMVTIK